MIARTWTGRTRLEDSDEYLDYLQRTGMAGFRSTPGNLAAWVLRRPRKEYAEFLVISLWDSLESIRGFCGENVEQARYFPEDQRFLLEMSPTVDLFEVAASLQREN